MSVQPTIEWETIDVPTFVHLCNGEMKSYVLNERWSWDRDQDTVAPSLHCGQCGTHGFWINGRWKSV